MPAFSGTKWGGNAQGSSGGVVTWSLIGAGRTGVIAGFGTDGFGIDDDKTSNGQSVAGFDVIAALRGAFQSWEDVADIEFVQVVDGGERVIGGHSADIRVAFGHIDGVGGVLGSAYFPTSTETRRAGDILFDEDDYSFRSSLDKFVAVAAHEIGHSIGLSHVDDPAALLFPFVGEHTTPQPDDILGARQIYGRPRDASERVVLDENTPDVQIIQRKDGLNVRGSSADNDIIGAAGDEELRGLAGNDRLIGAGGADRLFGGAGDDFQRGGGGLDRLFGNGGEDTLIGGGRSDFLKGGGGADVLNGGGGADELQGNGREDTLNGGRGDDTLKGGGGADVFVLTGGRDTVLDFSVRVDRIDTSAQSGLSDLLIQDSTAGAVISVGARTIVLQGVEANELTDDQFIFAGDQSESTPQAVASDPASEIAIPDDEDGADEFDAALAEGNFHDHGQHHEDDHADDHFHDHFHGGAGPYSASDLLL